MLYDFSGPTGRTIVVSVPRNGATWFIKLNGDAAVVGDAKPGFIDFLASVRFPGAAAAAPGDAVAKRFAGVERALELVENGAGSDGFQELFDWGQFRQQRGSDSELFPWGRRGGFGEDVNRWRVQTELPEVADLSLNGLTENVDTLGGTGLMVDFDGTGSKAGKRLVAVIVPHGANTWFYKLIGDRALVATQKDGFVNFVKNVHYPAN